jgi:hypothetical protein
MISNKADRLIVRRQGILPLYTLYKLSIYRSAHRRAHPSGHDAALRYLGAAMQKVLQAMRKLTEASVSITAPSRSA